MWRSSNKRKTEATAKLCQTKLGTVEYSIREPEGERAGYIMVSTGIPGYHDGRTNGYKFL